MRGSIRRLLQHLIRQGILVLAIPGCLLLAVLTAYCLQSGTLLWGRFIVGVLVIAGLLAVAAHFLAMRLHRKATEPLLTLLDEPALKGDNPRERLSRQHVVEELLPVVDSVNSLLDRLETALAQARRFSADAAHELKTPLAIAQGELEKALELADHGSREQQTYSSMLVELQRLKTITHKLMLLSLADSERLPMKLRRFDLSNLLENLLEDMRAIGDHLEFVKDVPNGLSIDADIDLLTQALLNITTNAVRYNVRPDGAQKGFVVLQVRKQAGNGYIISVGNTGYTIPAEDATQIFDRFYRRDRSHSRTIEGTGLGLSLSQEIIRAHKGSIRLATDDAEKLPHPESGSGPLLTTFIIELPAQGGAPLTSF